MLHQLWRGISYLGVYDGLHHSIRSKVVLSNRLAATTCFVFLCYILLSFTHTYSLRWILFVGFVSNVSVLIFNYLGLFTLARLVIVLAGIFITTSFSVLQYKPIAFILPEFVGFHMVTIAAPWALFAWRERGLIVFATALAMMPIVFYFQIDLWFPQKLGEVSDINSPYSQGNTITAVIILLGILWFLVESSNYYEKKYNATLASLAQQHEAISAQKHSLEDSIAELNLLREEEQKTVWQQSGITALSNVMQESNSHTELAQKFLPTLARHIDARLGAWYAHHPPYLQRLAGYGLSREQLAQPQLPAQFGLLGEAIDRHKILTFHNLPEDYWHINSGLGEVLPSCVVVVPITFQDQVEAVIELALWHTIQSHQMEFLQRIAQMLAITTHRFKANSETQVLLDNLHTQIQALQQQEHTMREQIAHLSNLEKHFADREAQYQAQIAILEARQA